MAMAIESKLSWIPSNNGQYPSHAVRIDNHAVVARAHHEGRWTPGKLVVSGHGCAYIPYGGKEIGKHDYEVLAVTACREGHDCYIWAEVSHGQVPPGAILAGVDGDGESLFVARAIVNGEYCGGKLKVSHRGAYMPWGGKEHLMHYYSVLCLRV